MIDSYVPEKRVFIFTNVCTFYLNMYQAFVNKSNRVISVFKNTIFAINAFF